MKPERKLQVEKRLEDIGKDNKKITRILAGLDAMEGRGIIDTERHRGIVLKKQDRLQKEKKDLEKELTN